MKNEIILFEDQNVKLEVNMKQCGLIHNKCLNYLIETLKQ